MRHLLQGSRPPCRHDGKPFNQSDYKRAKKSGNLPFHACLNQVRGDWDWMGKCFHLPFHNAKQGCCWLCTCKRNQVRNDNNNFAEDHEAPPHLLRQVALLNYEGNSPHLLHLWEEACGCRAMSPVPPTPLSY